METPIPAIVTTLAKANGIVEVSAWAVRPNGDVVILNSKLQKFIFSQAEAEVAQAQAAKKGEHIPKAAEPIKHKPPQNTQVFPKRGR